MRGHLGWLAVSVPLVAVALGGSASVGAQPQAKAGTSRPWTVPRTPDGRPDLQGVWTNATLTPLERPRAMADRATLTEQEAAALEAQAAWYTLTPDAQPLLGAVPGVAGLYVATGFSGHGFKLAPAVGLGLAQIVLGEPVSAFDVGFFSPARFAHGTRPQGGPFGL